VRVLLDENLPHDLVGALAEHAVSTVQGLGSAGTQNGALLRRASDVEGALGGRVPSRRWATRNCLVYPVTRKSRRIDA
jgi:hypothetical protein